MSYTKIVLVGGGTGGHFYPLIAIAESLREIDTPVDLYYFGPDAYDEKALAKHGISFMSVPAGKRRRYFSFYNYIDIVKTFFGLCVAVVKLYWIYPDVVVSKGGYTSVPVVLAAAFLRIPIVIHESDAKMGSANRLAMRFARAVVIAYEDLAVSLTHAQMYTLGIPIRKALQSPISSNAHVTFNISNSLPVILVIGGSQGAERINDFILDSLEELLPEYNIIHQTGKSHYDLCVRSADTLIQDEAIRARYHPVAYLDDVGMNDVYHLAHVVISRAGSNSIYEIAVHGKPSIIIPIPEDVSHDQRTNAYAYARSGAAVVIEEKNMSDDLLRSEIDRIMQDVEVYAQMSASAQSFGKQNSANEVASLIIDIAKQH